MNLYAGKRKQSATTDIILGDKIGKEDAQKLACAFSVFWNNRFPLQCYDIGQVNEVGWFASYMKKSTSSFQ